MPPAGTASTSIPPRMRNYGNRNRTMTVRRRPSSTWNIRVTRFLFPGGSLPRILWASNSSAQKKSSGSRSGHGGTGMLALLAVVLGAGLLDLASPRPGVINLRGL
ncbi:hypothetical protein C8R44DRAFT_740450 [Mycena epipterygia]|nr:hypothetical protein C8R44DRAFT_740450 [Mycena epipterygia]